MPTRWSLCLLAALVGGCPAPKEPWTHGSSSDSDTASDPNSGFPTSPDTDTSLLSGEALPMDCSACSGVGSSLEAVLCALDLCDEALVVDAEHRVPVRLLPDFAAGETLAAIPRFGAPSNDLVPRKNGSYVTIATGAALDLNHNDHMDDGTILELDPFIPSLEAPMRDVVELRVVLRIPPKVRALRFQYVFFSAEYDEYVGSPYDDKFYAILEAPSTNHGAPTVINFAECRNPAEKVDYTGPVCPLDSGECCYISVNSALSECCWVDDCPLGPATTDLRGTGYSCALENASDSASFGSSTGWLTTAWPVEPGELIALTFHLHDTMDSGADSQVLIDALELLTEPRQGTSVVK